MLTRFTGSGLIDPANERPPSRRRRGEGSSRGHEGQGRAERHCGPRRHRCRLGERRRQQPRPRPRDRRLRQGLFGLHDPRPGTRQHTGSADAAEKGKASFAGNGDFRVGADIEPGTYRTTGNTDGSCHWERAEDAGHGLDSLIAEGDVTGTAVVTISAKDTYFKTSGCGDWKKTRRRTPHPPG